MAENESKDGAEKGAESAAAPTKPEGRFNFNTVLALIVVAAAVGLYFLIPHQIAKPRFKINPNALNPDLFPRVAAISLFVVGLIYLFAAKRMTEINMFGKLNREAVVNVVVTVLAAAAYVFVIVGEASGRHIGVDFGDVKIGFVIPSTILIFVLSVFYGNRNWILNIAAAVCVPVTIYLVFTKFLLQSLPDSPITDWAYRYALTVIG